MNLLFIGEVSLNSLHATSHLSSMQTPRVQLVTCISCILQHVNACNHPLCHHALHEKCNFSFMHHGHVSCYKSAVSFTYNPAAATFGHEKMVWGHSISNDLINWTHLNDAIVPTIPGDINSCWSGSATILPGEKPAMLYTGIDQNRHQVQNLAMPKNLSDPYLREWEKHPQNPLMTPPSGVEVGEFRDPSTAWQGKDGKWRVIIGAQNGDEGKIILYKSEDFVKWIVDPIPFFATDDTGVCECPDFFTVYINSTNGVDTTMENSSVRHVLK
ncbi:putative glycosidase [Medicago truncatula]|uniref:Putative glycosidase n=1 Tax=Medicago truncatula TaxID=3880 RepID=A0A396JIX2_MEDTR|nr:putative glycosidase [Medicago truncatula]